MPNIEANIKIAFKNFKDIFEVWYDNYPPIKKSKEKNKRVIVYIPKPMSVHDLSGSEGIKLKDDVGFIILQQVLNKSGEPISYSYRFVSSEYEYLICRKNHNDSTCGSFYFYFDKCEDEDKHKPHVTVINPSIRYISRDIKLDEFLEFIRDHFYSLSKGKFVKKNGNIWDNRYV